MRAWERSLQASQMTYTVDLTERHLGLNLQAYVDDVKTHKGVVQSNTIQGKLDISPSGHQQSLPAEVSDAVISCEAPQFAEQEAAHCPC